MLCSISEVHYICNDERYSTSEKYLLMHAKMVGHRTANENSNSNADVPTAEIRAVSCAALVMTSQVHAHGLVAGEDKSKTRADKERRNKERNRPMAKREHDVSDNVERHSRTDEMNKVTSVNQTPRRNAIDDETCGNQCVKPAGATDAEFIRIKCDVVRDRAVSESDKDEVCELRNSSCEEESIKRKRSVRFFLLAGNAQRLYKNKPDNAQNNRNSKDDGIAECFVKEHACHRASRKSEIHADAEVADAFATAACRESVNRNHIACRRRNSKEKSMCKSYYCENRQKSDSLVTDKAKRKREERPEVKRLAAERIDKEPSKRAASESANRIKRNDNARSRIVRLKFVDDE